MNTRKNSWAWVKYFLSRREYRQAAYYLRKAIS